MELYKMLRDHTGALRVVDTGELGKFQGVAEELKYIDQSNSGLVILAIHNRISWKDQQHHTHHPQVTIGSPVYGRDRRIIALATLTIDLTNIVENFQYDFMVTGDGDYIYHGMPHDIEHRHGPGLAFSDYPGL
jgi:hypothetical protein